MEDFEEPESSIGEENVDGEASSLWEEAKARGRRAGERLGDYAEEHSVGVALGSFGIGVALGVLIGVLVARD
jgi:hypothetical protein